MKLEQMDELVNVTDVLRAGRRRFHGQRQTGERVPLESAAGFHRSDQHGAGHQPQPDDDDEQHHPTAHQEAVQEEFLQQRQTQQSLLRQTGLSLQVRPPFRLKLTPFAARIGSPPSHRSIALDLFYKFAFGSVEMG